MLERVFRPVRLRKALRRSGGGGGRSRQRLAAETLESRRMLDGDAGALRDIQLAARETTRVLVTSGDHLNSVVRGFSQQGDTAGVFAEPGLATPIYAAVDVHGDVLITSIGTNTVSRYSSNGSYLGTLADTGISGAHGIAVLKDGTILVGNWESGSGTSISRYSASGTYEGPFTTVGVHGPHGIVEGPDGNVYVANYFNNGGTSVSRFTREGDFLGAFSSPKLLGVQGLAFDRQGNLLVASAALGTVEKFTANGIYRGQFASGINGASGVAVDSDGTVYVSEYWESVVRRYDSSGRRLSNLADASDGISKPIGINIVSVPSTASRFVVGENNAVGSVVSPLRTTSWQPGDTISYSLVAGDGDEDNAAFSIVGSELRAATTFDFETKASYSLRIRATSRSGASYEKAFTIEVADEEEPLAVGGDFLDVFDRANALTRWGGIADQPIQDFEGDYFYAGGITTAAVLESDEGVHLRLASVMPEHTVRGVWRQDSFASGDLEVRAVFSPTGGIDGVFGLCLQGDRSPGAFVRAGLFGADYGKTRLAYAHAGEGSRGDESDGGFVLVDSSGSHAGEAWRWQYGKWYSLKLRVRENSTTVTVADAADDGVLWEATLPRGYAWLGDSLRVGMVQLMYTPDPAGQYLAESMVERVTLTRLAAPPAGIELSAVSIPENRPAGTKVADLAPVPFDPTSVYTASLVSGAGSDDNAAFMIVGGELRTARTFDYESKSSYSIRLRVTNQDGESAENAFAIGVVDVNESPTDIVIRRFEELARFADEGIGASLTDWWDGAVSLDGDGVASYVASGAGVVRTWRIGDDLSLLRERDYWSPDTVYDSPSHGISIVTDGKFLGIGSPHTWVHAPHDGRFYVYDSSTGARVTSLNPDPHPAQYFNGGAIAREENYFVVAEGGNAGWGTCAAITVYAYDPETLGSSLIGRHVFLSTYAYPHALQVVSGHTIVAAAYLGGEDRFVLQSWRVTTDAEGRATGIEADAVLGESLNSWVTCETGVAVLATDGTLIALSNPGVPGGKVELFRNDGQGNIRHVGSIDPPSGATPNFGRSLVFHGSQLLVGSPDDDVGLEGTGSVHVYEIAVDGTETLVERIVPKSMAAGETFGRAIALSEGRILVTAGVDSAYLFRREANAHDAIEENAPVGSVVGSLSAVDPDAGDSFLYALVEGDGADHNGSFAIVGATVLTSEALDYEAGGSRSIRVRVTDSGGAAYEKVVVLAVTDVNEAPTDIALSPASIAENGPVGATVGTLSSVDPDSGDSFTYSLVPGDGDSDNPSFTIEGDELRAAVAFDHEAKQAHTIRVRSMDSHGLWTEKSFVIAVEDVLDTPTIRLVGDPFAALSSTYGSVSAVGSALVEGLFLVADVTATAPAGFEISADGSTWGATASFTVTGGEFTGTLSARLAATAGAGAYGGDVTLASDEAPDLAIALPSSTIAKKTLTVLANDQMRPYGQSNPANWATITGFANGDTAAVVSGTPAFSVAATAASPVGTYAITPTPGSLTARNYAFADLRPGTLTVTRAAVTVTADTLRKAVGDADPTLTYGVAGFRVTADDPLSGQLAGTLSREPGEGAGTYAITAGSLALVGAAIDNYDLTFVPGALEIVAVPRLFVTGAFARGAAWAAEYLGLPVFTTTGGGAKLGVALGGGSAQLANASQLTWSTIDTISLRFSEPVNLPAASALSATGVTNSATAGGKGTQATLVPVSVTLLEGGTIVQWRLPTNLVSGKWVASIADGAITTAVGGRPLDGEWTTSSSTFATGSGDGTAGGEFRYRFNVLVGDVIPATGSAATVVDAADVNAVKAALGQPGSAANHRMNLNGDATVNSTDTALVTAQRARTTLATLGDHVPELAAAVGATVDGPFAVTFRDDAAWRTAITGIKVGGAALPAAAYAIAAGSITFDPALSTLLRTAGTKAIVVSASGRPDSAVSQRIGAGAAAALRLATQPVGPTASGGLFATAPVVHVIDRYGNQVQSTATILAVAQSGTGTWSLGGTTSVAASGGVARFTALRATNTGASTVTTARIRFSSGALTLVVSGTFRVPR